MVLCSAQAAIPALTLRLEPRAIPITKLHIAARYIAREYISMVWSIKCLLRAFPYLEVLCLDQVEMTWTSDDRARQP